MNPMVEERNRWFDVVVNWEEVHETLKKAKAILAKRGMVKGRLQVPSGEVCMTGAMVCAYRGGFNSAPFNFAPVYYVGISPAEGAVLEACQSAMGLTTVVEFNDAPKTTLEMALEAFQRGIDATAPQTPEPAAELAPELAPEPERELVLA